MLSSTIAHFVEQLFSGVSLGSIYALIALGYTMVYGIIQLINFAHGEIIMVGAFASFYAISFLGLDFFSALLVGMLASSILGMVIEKVAYRPLRYSPRLTALITAIGASIFLQNAGLMIFGVNFRAFPQVLPQRIYHIPLADRVLTVSSYQVFILVITFLMMFFLQYIVSRTKLGKAMRAVSFDKDTARLMGISVDQTISYTFAIGSALAAVAGVLMGLYYNQIWPLMGLMPGLKAFIAAVLGGIGIIPGAMAGGFLLGIVEALVSGYWSSTWRDVVVFGLLILILLVRPSGLLGKWQQEKV